MNDSTPLATGGSSLGNQRENDSAQFDMFDSDDELNQWKVLNAVLSHCNSILSPICLDADSRALRFQRLHRVCVSLAALCGTLAVLCAIIQLSGLFEAPWPMWVEVLAAAGAGCAVVLGLISASQAKWLLARHQAEAARLLKFRFLTEPSLWCGGGAQQVTRMERLRNEAAAITRITRGSLYEWIEQDEVPDPPTCARDCRLPAETVRALIDYYERKRLDVQIAYFERQSSRNVRLNRLLGRFPPVLFFGSVAAALGHFACQVYHSTPAGSHISVDSTSAVLIVVAAGLPILAAGVRVYRSAYEFARNKTRYRAKVVTLKHLREAIETEKARAEPDCQKIVREFWCIEQLLESEHREWLRLMLDAEWFG